MALKTGMELVYELLWATCAAIILSILVPMIFRVLSDASCGDDRVKQNRAKTITGSLGISNGEKRARRNIEKEGKFDGRLKVKGSKSNKKKKVKFADETTKIVEFQAKEETNIVTQDREIAHQSVESIDQKVNFPNVSGEIEVSNAISIDLPEEGSLIEEVLVKELEGNKEQEADSGTRGLIEEVEGSLSSEHKESADTVIGCFDKETDKGNELNKLVEQRREKVGFNEVDAESAVYLFGVRIGKSVGSKKIGEEKLDYRPEDKAVDQAEPKKIEIIEENERKEINEHGEGYQVSGESSAIKDVRDQKIELQCAGSEEIEGRRNEVDAVADNNIADKIGQKRITENEGTEGKNWTGDKDGIRLTGDEVIDDQSEEVSTVTSDGKLGTVNAKEEIGEIIDQEEGVLSDEDGWEGIERSELDKGFARAADFVERGDKDGRLASLGDDVMKQLHGLRKVAVEGPCQEPQPMALKRAARAKWNAWQKLGNMSPEDAMEQFITLLSDNIPGWDENLSGVEAGAKSTDEVNSSNSVIESGEATVI